MQQFKQNYSGLNRDMPSIYFLKLRSVDHVKCMERCLMCRGKQILVEVNIYKWAKEKVSPCKHTDNMVSKESYANSILGDETTNHY